MDRKRHSQGSVHVNVYFYLYTKRLKGRLVGNTVQNFGEIKVCELQALEAG